MTTRDTRYGMKMLLRSAIGIVLLLAVLPLVRGMTPRRVAANVIIEEPGRYRSPTGDCLAEIWEGNEGELKFSVYRLTAGGRSGGGPVRPFRAESDWFMCWDAQDRLWTYVPEHDRQYCRYWYANDEASGSCRVGELGGWEGTPPAFSSRLPRMAKDTYERYINTQCSAGSAHGTKPGDRDVTQ